MKTLIISKKAKDILVKEIQRIGQIETGGILCGYYSDCSLVIDSASGPGPNALHEVAEFIVDKNYMYEFLDQEYATSGGRNIYLGEWHTHPQQYPIPSEQDLQSIYERTLEWHHGEIAFLIIGFVGFTDQSLLEQSFALFYDSQQDKFYRIRVELQ